MSPVISCLTTSYGRHGAEACIASIRDAGLEHIELLIRTDGYVSRHGDPPLITHTSSLADLERIDRLLERHGVRVASCNVISGNPLDPAVVPIVERKIELASHFGVKLVVAEAGAVADDSQRETLYASLWRIGDCAAARGITICFETHPGVCGTHREMLRLMRDLDHPNLRLNFDTANLLFYNADFNSTVEVALAKVCHLVKHVHLKDHTGEHGRRYFPALGCGGAVDFLRVYQILRDCGFQGPYSLEIAGIEGEPDLSLADQHRRVVESVAYLRMLGYFE